MMSGLTAWIKDLLLRLLARLLALGHPVNASGNNASQR